MLFSDDTKYKLVGITKGEKYYAHVLDDNTLSIINDSCLVKRVERKDFRICVEN